MPDRKREYRGLPIIIEFDKGEKRPWKDEAGNKQFTTMKAPYGYIRGTKGVDGDDVDVYLGAADSDKVFVVRQMKKGDWKRFDEEKCILGVDSAEAAKALYLAHYNDEKFFGGLKELSWEEFMNRLETRGQEGKKLAQAKRPGVLGTRRVDEVPGRGTDFNVAMTGGEKVADDERAHRISDRIDDVGIGVLASPYIAGAMSKGLAHRNGVLGAVGRAADAYKHKFEAAPLAEVGGLALVAPGITHRLAHGLDKATTKKADVVELQKEAFVGALRSMAAPLLSGAKSLVQRGGKALGGLTPAAPAASPTVPNTARKLLGGANIAKAGLIGGGALGLYAGKKVIDAGASLAQSHSSSMAPPAYQAPRVI